MKVIKSLIILMVLILIFSCGLGLLVFRKTHSDNLERVIVSKIRQETPYLANFEAIYGFAFTNFRDKPFPFSDNYYIRQDQARVFYGYSLKDAIIKIKKEDDTNILWVRLPDPKQVSIDRKIASLETLPKGYKPLDANKKEINVEKWMKKNLDEAINLYEEKSIEKTKEMSRKYFEALAHRFGLELQLEFT